MRRARHRLTGARYASAALRVLGPLLVAGGPLLVSPAAALAWAPLRSAEGTPLAWPAAAWPLPLWTSTFADQAAAAAWTALGPARFAVRGPGAGAPVPEAGAAASPAEAPGLEPLAPDGQVVVVDVAAAADWAALVGDPALVGFALVTHADGALVDVDVVLNTARFPLAETATPARHLRRTVVQHELGHALGLGHPCGDAHTAPCANADEAALTSAVYPRIGPGDARGPNADDAAGLAAVVQATPAVAGPLEAPRLGAMAATPAEWHAAVQPLEVGDRLAVWGERAASGASPAAEPLGGAPRLRRAHAVARAAGPVGDEPGGDEPGEGRAWRLAGAGRPPVALSRWSADGRGATAEWPAAPLSGDLGSTDAAGSAVDASPDAQGTDAGPGATDWATDLSARAADTGCAVAPDRLPSASLPSLSVCCLTLLGWHLALRRVRQGEFTS